MNGITKAKETFCCSRQTVTSRQGSNRLFDASNPRGLAELLRSRRMNILTIRAGLGTAALGMAAVMFTEQWLGALILLSLVYGGITFQQPTMFGYRR